MIQAVIFDLDGTLVQTERLKAHSYAKAAVELCPHTLTESEVVEAFKEVVGKSRREVAQTLVERFQLAEAAAQRAESLGVRTSWQAFVQVRLNYYEAMLADPEAIIENRWPHTLALLEAARKRGCVVALATMSRCKQANKVLAALELREAFTFIATRDDVERAKPDPEIYLLVSSHLDIHPEFCLVIEDSPVGVQAALSAGMGCVAVSTPFTRDHLHSSGLLEEHWIVDDPARLAEVVSRFMAGTPR